MAELNKIQFLLVVSLMVCSSYATKQLLLANVNQTHAVSYDSSIGGFEPANFSFQHDTTKVIIYVCTLKESINIIHHQHEKELIAAELRNKKYELLYLGIEKGKNKGIEDFIRLTVKIEADIELLGHVSSLIKYERLPYERYTEDFENKLQIRIIRISFRI